MKQIAKILTLCSLALILTLAINVKIAVAVDCENIFTSEYWENAGDCFLGGGGESGSTSFTDFRGGLKAPSTEGYDASLTQITSAREFIITIVNFALGFLGLIAIVIIIYGGFRYVTAAGESEGVEKGKKSILYAVIGIVIITASFAIVNTVLKAPSGTDRDVVTAEPGFSAAPAASSLGGSYSNQILTLSRNLLANYSNYAASTFSIEAIERSFDTAWKKTGFRSFDDGVVALSEIENHWNTVRNELDKIANRSGALSTIRDRIAQQKLFFGLWLEKGQERGEFLKKNPPLDCSDVDFNWTTDIVNKKTYDNLKDCATDPSGNYYEEFVNQWNEVVKLLKEGSLPGSIDGSYKAIKAELEKEKQDNLRKIKKDLEVMKAALQETIQPNAENPNDPIALLTEIISGSDTGGGIDSLIATTDVKVSKNILQGIISDFEKLFEILKNLKSVRVKLTANTYEGNAPLIVNFSTVGSNDPSEKTITNDRITWFPGETCAMKEGDNTCPLFGDNSVLCSPAGAVASCIFKKPGSYKIGAKMTSSDPSQFATGIAFVSVNVKAPSGQINLTYKTKDKETSRYAIHYNEEGVLIENKDILYLALSIAQQGIEFSAAETKDAVQFKWNFGDGSGEIIGSPEESSIASPVHAYTKEGRYRVVLEVTAKDGSVNRKILDIIVAKMSVGIDVIPGNVVRTGTSVELRGTISSDRGRATGQWNATAEGKDNEADKIQGTDPILHIVFDKPAKYHITYTAENESSDIDPAKDEIDLTIESNPPIAKFKVSQPKKYQPADFLLDSSPSYDPDGPNSSLTYDWEVEGDENKDYKFIEGNAKSEKPIIRFLKKGEYPVRLVVEDENEPGKGTFDQQVVKVTNLLDIEWPEENPASGKLDINQKVALTFTLKSENAENFDIDFGDSEVESGVFENGKGEIKHTFTQAGAYVVKVTVYDEEGNKNTLTRRIIIGGSENPLAVGKILINSQEVDTSELIIVDRKTSVTFDAGHSINTKGEKSGLKYSWSFGDGKKSTKPVSTYIYKNISPANPGFYKVTLTVTDENDASKTDIDDTIKVLVVNQKPFVKSLVAIPQGQDLKTPMSVNVKAIEPKDPDGQIVSYKWWYYDVRAVDIPLSTKITTGPSVVFNIGTRGEEGALVDYIFDMEMKDDEGQTVTVSNLLNQQKQQPTLSVINGPNKIPVAKFSVSKTNIKSGESITFSSTSVDPDGQIIQYIWDLEGDGFQNNEETEKSSITATFPNAAPQGIKVRLKVIDNNYGEAVSDPVTIYVTPSSNPPVADFAAKQISGTNKIAFTDKSTADNTKGVSVIGYTWDFNTAYDNDGDGKKDNDTDSTEKNPVNEYPAPGKYQTKLTVKDSAGVFASVTKLITVDKGAVTSSDPAALAPKSAVGPTAGTGTTETDTSKPPYYPAAPASSGTPTSGSSTSAQILEPIDARLKTKPDINLIDGKIHLKGEVGTIEFDYSESKGPIAVFQIDKNIYFDTDGNGVKDDDADHTSKTPGKWSTDFQKAWGKIGIKLNVFDAAGNKDSVLREIMFEGGYKSGANNIFMIPGAGSLYGALASMFGFGILVAKRRKRKIRKQH